MPSTLIFPDGVRLARRDELPGPEEARAAAWARIEAASIAPGFTLQAADDPRFSHYAEINVDAPKIFEAFRDLCEALLAPQATLIMGAIDEEPKSVRSDATDALLASLALERHRLAHDCLMQFGLASEDDGEFNEVFVAPTKHFKVWLNNEERFRAIMRRHDLPETNGLEFIDQYARTTVTGGGSVSQS